MAPEKKSANFRLSQWVGGLGHALHHTHDEGQGLDMQ